MDLVISILIVVAVQFGMFVLLRSRIDRELNATTLLKDVQDEVDGMVRELNLSAERNIQLLESRIQELEGLLTLSDQKLVLMAKELDRRERAAETYSKLKKPQAELPSAAPPAQPDVAVVQAPEPSPDVTPMPASGQLELDVPDPAPRSLTERVLGFRDQGLDPGAIAVATGATRGEVELILSLNPLTTTR